MKKVAIYFTNNKGKYYIENVCVITGDTIPGSSYNHVITRIIDETIDWRNYEKTEIELANPTTKDADVLVVVKELEENKKEENK